MSRSENMRVFSGTIPTLNDPISSGSLGVMERRSAGSRHQRRDRDGVAEIERGHTKAREFSDATVDPDQYTLAIVCAIEKEFNAIQRLFDGASETYRGPRRDHNIYVVGRFAGHQAVLMMPGDRGELEAGICVQRLCDHFQSIELTLLVGICGAMGYNSNTEEPIYLGDVVFGTQVWRYLHDARSSQLPDGMGIEVRNVRPEDSSQRIKQLSKLLLTDDFRARTMNLSLSYLSLLQEKANRARYEYPGYENDRLFKADSLHRHRSPDSQCSCLDRAQSNCDRAKGTSCKTLGCIGVERERHHSTTLPGPKIHVGTIASADLVMRSRSEFAAEFKMHNVLGVEMEGGGVSKATDCIVIKGVADYADTHKNKHFAHYAAATAACAAKAFLMTLYPGTTRARQTHQSMDSASLDTHYRQTRSTIPRPTAVDLVDVEDQLGWVTATGAYSSWIERSPNDKPGRSRILWCQSKGKSTTAELLWPYLRLKDFSVLYIDSKHPPSLPSNHISSLSSLIPSRSEEMGPGKVHRIIWGLLMQSFGMASPVILANSFGEHVLDFIPPKENRSKEHLANLTAVLSGSMATWATKAVVIVDRLECLNNLELTQFDRAMAGLLGGLPRARVMLHSKVMKNGGLLRENSLVIDENTAYQECCATFAFENMTQRRDHIAAACIDTNHWVWSNPSYLTLVSDSSSNALWIAGKPGSGKSVLARTIEQSLTAKKGFEDAVVSTWFYSIRDNLVCQSEMLSGLLFQMISAEKRVFQVIAKEYRQKLVSENGVRWGFDELKQMFSDIVRHPAVMRPFAFVLDGIDESSMNGVQGECSRGDMLRFFLRLLQQSPTRGLKMIFLSRPEDDIRKRLRKLPSIVMHQVNLHDIAKVTDVGIERIMEELRALGDSDSESDDSSTWRTTTSYRDSLFSRADKDKAQAKLVRHLRQYLIHNANGVILWVASVLGHIVMLLGSAFCTMDQIVREIERLPTELSDVYVTIVHNMTMDRRQSPTLRLAQRALLWVRSNPSLGKFYAQDLLEVLALDQEAGGGGWAAVDGWRSFHRQLRRLCGPFLEIVTDKTGWNCDPYDPVQLLHQTVKTFLDDPQASGPLYLSREESQRRFHDDCAQYMHKTLPLEPWEWDPFRRGTTRTLAQVIDDITFYLDGKPLLSFILTFNSGMAAYVPRRFQEILKTVVLWPPAEGGLGVGGIQELFYQACKKGRVNAVCALFAVSSSWLHPWEWYLIEPEIIRGTLQAAQELSLDHQVRRLYWYAYSRTILPEYSRPIRDLEEAWASEESGFESESDQRSMRQDNPTRNTTRLVVRAINEVLLFWMQLGASSQLRTSDAFEGAANPHFADSAEIAWRMAIIRATVINSRSDDLVANVSRRPTPSHAIALCGIRATVSTSAFPARDFGTAVSNVEQGPKADGPPSLAVFMWQQNLQEAIERGSDHYGQNGLRQHCWFRDLPPILPSIFPREEEEVRSARESPEPIESHNFSMSRWLGTGPGFEPEDTLPLR